MNVDVSNKVVVITGASKGIGKELAKKFAEEQSFVIINYYHSEKKAKELFEEILLCNQNCMLIKADITNPSSVSKMYYKIIKRYGRVDVLINNAGICDDNFIQIMPLYQWKSVIDVNLTGTFLCCREFSKIMIKQKEGTIINIASLKGQEGSIGQTNYSASKGGIIAFTKSLAKELAKYNILVNAVCPGFIQTDLNKFSKKKFETAKSQSLLSINNNLSDLTQFIVYLSSNKVRSVTGSIINIDSRINSIL